MSTLFEPVKLGTLTLRNRFVRSATWEAMATPAGEVTPKLVDTIAALARGGVGLIISSHAYVSPEGQAGPGQIGVHTDAMIPGLKRMAAAAHDHGAKMVLQLAHAGYLAIESLTGRKPLAVSTACAWTRPSARRSTRPASGGSCRRLCGCRRPRHGGGLRRRPDPRGPRLPLQPVPVAALQPAHRRLRRAGRQPGAGDRGDARGRAAGGRGRTPDPGQGQRPGLRGGGAGGGRRGRGGGPDGECGAGRDRDQQRHVQVRKIGSARLAITTEEKEAYTAAKTPSCSSSA